ncbi:MAG: glycosyltransferase family 9 protein [Candidatus Omnitrophota bacterium]
MSNNILIMNPFGIGDVIFSTPLIDILRKRFPDSFIAYVCNKRSSELLNTNPNLNKIFIYEKDDYRIIWERSRLEYCRKLFQDMLGLKKFKFNIFIDLSMAYQYSLLAKVVGIKKRIGFNYRNRGRFLTDKINIKGFDEKHVIECYLAILTLLDIDIKKYPVSPRIYVTDCDLAAADKILEGDGIKKSDLLIGVVPGCGASWGVDAAHRRWDRKNFAVLADKLIDKYNAKIVLFGDKKEVEICSDVQSAMKHEVVNYCGKTSLPELAAFISRCNLVVTNDGGPLHMAVGLGVNTVSIFGPVDEKIYGPYMARGDHRIIFNKGLSCRPCYRKFKYSKCEKRVCLDGISVEDVLAGAESILKR